MPDLSIAGLNTHAHATRVRERLEEGQYGVVAPIAYNIEHIPAFVRAAEAKRSPLIIQAFHWAITFSSGLLVHAAASVPVTIHLDYAQDADMIRHATDNLPFDSIMVDMSHYEMEENLVKTKDLVAYCHARGIATEAETGRLGEIRQKAAGRVRIVLHGTNDFPEDLMQKCIRGGVTKVNVNKLVLDDYLVHLKKKAPTLSLTTLMEEDVKEAQRLTEWQMHVCKSAGKA